MGSNQSPDELTPRQAWRMLQTMWVAELAAALLIWLGLPGLVQVDPAKTVPSWFLYIFAGIASVDIGTILWFKGMMRRRGAGARTIGDLTGRVFGLYLVVIAVAIGPAIYGGIFYYTSGNRFGLGILCLGALIALVLARPRLEDWLDLLPSTQLD